MGTVSLLHERIRAPAHRIQSDEEAFSVAEALAADFARQASDRDINRIMPYNEFDALSRSGLLGISVPSEHDGLDMSNSGLAEVVAILSRADPSIAQIPQNHFFIIEALRADGSNEQKSFFFARALAGDCFAGAHSETVAAAGDHSARLTPDGLGYRIKGRKLHSTAMLFADWIGVFAPDPADRQTISFVQRGAEGIQLIDDWDGFGQRTTGSGTAIFHDVYVSADAVVPHYKGFDRPTTIDPVGQIVHAGIDLGIARAAFDETINFIRNAAQPWSGSSVGRAADDPLTIERIGRIAIRLEAATATLDRAGKKIDVAQINPTEANVVDASLAVAVAKVLTTEIAIEASDMLFELAGTPSTRIGTNLDRHWRNARTHTLHDPVRWKYHGVGNYHLNGKPLPRNNNL